MADIHSALVTTYKIKPENKERLLKALEPAKVTFCELSDREGIKEAVADADVAILFGDLDDLILSGQKLRFIHCCHAGLDRSARPEVFERGIILTGSSGRSAPALAEHVLMFMLALTYDVPMLQRAKEERRWAVSRESLGKTGMYGKTAGILGVGNTGRHVARLLKQFDMRVLGWRRSAEAVENVDVIYSSDRGDSLDEILEKSDYIILCAELNDSTWHMIDKKQLDKMKQSAFLINIGRGALVNEEALAQALKNNSIAGAGLDTFEVEPLPEESELWDMPNVMITPHMTPKLPDKDERSLDYAIQNIEAYRRGEGFVNRLSERDIYTKGSKTSSEADYRKRYAHLSHLFSSEKDKRNNDE